VLSKRNTLTLLIAGLFLFNALNATVEIAPSNLLIPASLKGTRLFHEDGNFVIVKDGDAFPVKPEYMDKELRNLPDEVLDFALGLKAKVNINGEELTLVRISPEVTQELIADMADKDDSVQLSDKESRKIISQLPVSSYIKVFQYENGEFGLHLQPRLQGGGFWGGLGGYLLGKAVVHVAGQIVIWSAAAAVSVVCPVAFPAVLAGMEKALLPAVEIASQHVGLGTGVVGMLATGPV
jgi:hypothetical protein